LSARPGLRTTDGWSGKLSSISNQDELYLIWARFCSVSGLPVGVWPARAFMPILAETAQAVLAALRAASGAGVVQPSAWRT
jgi:hypothetical protein